MPLLAVGVLYYVIITSIHENKHYLSWRTYVDKQRKKKGRKKTTKRKQEKKERSKKTYVNKTTTTMTNKKGKKNIMRSMQRSTHHHLAKRKYFKNVIIQFSIIVVMIIYVMHQLDYGNSATLAYHELRQDTAMMENLLLYPSSSPSLNGKQVPRRLDTEQQNKPFVLLHVGKTGGESLNTLFEKSNETCYKNMMSKQSLQNSDYDMNNKNSTSGKRTTTATANNKIFLHSCFLSKRTSPQIHHYLNQQNYIDHTNYLVTVRNPIDRLISWFNFEIYFSERFRIRNMLFKHLWNDCYPTIGEMISNGLILDNDDDTPSSDKPLFPSVKKYIYFQHDRQKKQQQQKYTADGNNTTATEIATATEEKIATNHRKTFQLRRIEPGLTLSCPELATECLTGRFPCIGHNYYNYEVYLEDLFLWKQICIENNDGDDVGNTNITMTKRTEILRSYGPPHDTLDCNERKDIRIDVVRLEHFKVDINRTMELWTGHPIHDLEEDIGYVPMNIAKTNFSISRSTYVPDDAVTKLCTQICTELISYKKILYYADNLYDHDVMTSWKELDDRCGMNVDQVCGTKFTYRSIKRQKKII